MAPSKTSRAAHDDGKDMPANAKEKLTQNHHSNGKMRRGASSAGTNLREATSAAALPPPPSLALTTVATQDHSPPGLQWPAFNRDVLHSYRRAYRLNTPTAFSSDVRQWVLTKPGSIGLHSPTMARRKEFRRQSKDQLANAVRKHFNGLGVQENDIIVDFLHKCHTQQAVSQPTNKSKRPDSGPGEQ